MNVRYENVNFDDIARCQRRVYAEWPEDENDDIQKSKQHPSVVIESGMFTVGYGYVFERPRPNGNGTTGYKPHEDGHLVVRYDPNAELPALCKRPWKKYDGTYHWWTPKNETLRADFRDALHDSIPERVERDLKHLYDTGSFPQLDTLL
jgi:hypothetical protein